RRRQGLCRCRGRGRQEKRCAERGARRDPPRCFATASRRLLCRRSGSGIESDDRILSPRIGGPVMRRPVYVKTVSRLGREGFEPIQGTPALRARDSALAEMDRQSRLIVMEIALARFRTLYEPRSGERSLVRRRAELGIMGLTELAFRRHWL